MYSIRAAHIELKEYECFIADLACSLSYDLAPSPPPPLSPVGKHNQQRTRRLRKRDNLLMGEGEGVGEEPNHTAARKPGPL
jgi:hypothetical protein